MESRITQDHKRTVLPLVRVTVRVWRTAETLHFIGLIKAENNKSAYMIRHGNIGDSEHIVWKLVHRFKGLPKIKYFLWLVCRGRLMTNEERVRRCLTSDSGCVVCGAAIESIDHIFRKCPPALFVWRELVIANRLEEFMHMEIYDWVACNLLGNSFATHITDWSLLFGNILWNLWLSKNSIVFDSSRRDNGGIITRSWKLLETYRNVQDVHRQAAAMDVTGLCRPVRWMPPREPWIKLNTDGARSAVSGQASCGGVARDWHGQWCFGFSKFIGICSVVDAEVWGAYLGLVYAWEAGFKHVILELDSIEAIRIIKRGYDGLHNLRRHILDMWNRPWEIKVVHISRKGNQVADACAKIATSGNWEVLFFVSPPDPVGQLVQDESLVGSECLS